jgi:hypothetical protein
MDDGSIGAWLVLIAALVNLVFQVGMLAFNVVGVPLGVMH